MDGITSALNSGLDGINSQIRTINGGVQTAANAVTNFFTNSETNVNIPTFSLPEVSQRLSFSLPENFQASLKNLNSTVPDLEDAQRALVSLITTPFNALAENLNNSIRKVSFSELNLPVPAKAADAAFCDQVPVGWIPKMAEGISQGFTITIWILLVLGILIMMGNGVLIYFDHKRYERQAAGPSSLIYNKLSPKLQKISSRKRLGWFLDYTIYNPSFLFLGIGLLGIALIQLQLFILERAKISALQTVGNELVATSSIINNAVQKMVSETVDPYVLQSNRRIDEIEKQTNQIVFGWINETVRVINDTTSTFTAGFNDVISKSFDSVPPLKDAVSKFVHCMIGASFESILAIAETLQVSMYMQFPRVNSSIGSIDGDSLSNLPALAERMAVKLESKKQDSNGESTSDKAYVFEREVDRLVNYFKTILETQRIAFFVCTGFGISGWIFGLLGAIFVKF
jgi:hypothetical protein